MFIQRARPDQFSEMTVVWEDSVRATHDFLDESIIVALRLEVEKIYLPAVNSYCYTSDKEHIQGFIGISSNKIEMLFVASAAIGTGIGKLLLQFGIIQCGANEVDVNEHNPQAIAFYEHFGFRTYGRSPLDAQGRPFPILHMRIQ